MLFNPYEPPDGQSESTQDGMKFAGRGPWFWFWVVLHVCFIVAGFVKYVVLGQPFF